tara:strand:+ start:143 stop:325 length:183 start_codon:yes stop_codon:yes gene_type:complete
MIADRFRVVHDIKLATTDISKISLANILALPLEEVKEMRPFGVSLDAALTHVLLSSLASL